MGLFGRERRFLKVFKHEHEVILDQLLALRRAVKVADGRRAAELVDAMDRVMGPHFEVEEVGLYPMLRDYLGSESVDDLLEEHVGAVAAMHELQCHAGDPDWLLANGAGTIAKILDAMMMHVTSCDGLSIIVERFGKEQQRALGDVIDRVHATPQTLTEWRADRRSSVPQPAAVDR